MDRLVLTKDSATNLTIDKNSYVVISDDVQAPNLEINILDCEATIINLGKCENKSFTFKNSNVTLVEVINDKNLSSLNMVNDRSNVDYSIIDLYDENINYKIEEKSISEGNNIINIASVCYKNKTKNYVISTANNKGNSVNEVNCFGIVKDKSILNYDVSSFIEKGAKQSVVRQNSNILLFDENSLGKNNPILLIEENDVKASHGSSIGKIDDDTMFYLCSRGLSEEQARGFITRGYLLPVLSYFLDETIKEKATQTLERRVVNA